MSRKLYDLCRKYKYFYNKNKDVMEWDKKYHDIDLSDAIAKTRIDLGLVEHEIQKELFDIFDVKCKEMEICTTWDDSFMHHMMNRFCRYDPNSYATVEFKDSNRFLNVLVEYISEKRRWF